MTSHRGWIVLDAPDSSSFSLFLSSFSWPLLQHRYSLAVLNISRRMHMPDGQLERARPQASSSLIFTCLFFYSPLSCFFRSFVYDPGERESHPESDDAGDTDRKVATHGIPGIPGNEETRLRCWLVFASSSSSSFSFLVFASVSASVWPRGILGCGGATVLYTGINASRIQYWYCQCLRGSMLKWKKVC